MNQQIAPSVTSQTASTALKSANGQDKPAGKGLFARLVAMIEGKVKADHGADSEKAGTHLAETAVANPAISKTDKADADLFPVIKSDTQKIKSKQEDSSDTIIANAGFTVSNNNHDKNKLLTAIELAAANTKAEAKHTATSREAPSFAVRADTDQPVKAKAGAEIKQAAANPAASREAPSLTVRADTGQPVKTKAGAEIKQAAANPAADGKAPSLTVRADADQPVKASAESEIKQAAANPATGREKPAATLRPTAHLSSVTSTGHIASANEQRIAGMKPEQHSLSTNNFMHSHKLNSDNLSKPKAQLLQASSDKNPGTPAGNSKNPSMQPAAPLASSMKDMIFQADTLSRPNHQSHEVLNNQTFQVSNPDTASTLMRSAFQPLQSMPSSGPWAVTAAMQQIGHAAGQGKFQLELTLTPAHLGKVQVILESDANKQIQVHFIIDQPASRQPIEQHLPALRQALADQGLNMDSFSMESSEQHTDNQQNQQNRNAPSSTVIADAPSTVVKRADLPSDSRLSIRI